MHAYIPQLEEQDELGNLQFDLFKYSLLKNLIENNNIPLSFTIQQYFDMTEGGITEEPSKIVYLDALNEPADSMITMYSVLGSLKDHKSIFDTSGSLLVVRDAKT